MWIPWVSWSHTHNGYRAKALWALWLYQSWSMTWQNLRWRVTKIIRFIHQKSTANADHLAVSFCGGFNRAARMLQNNIFSRSIRGFYPRFAPRKIALYKRFQSTICPAKIAMFYLIYCLYWPCTLPIGELKLKCIDHDWTLTKEISWFIYLSIFVHLSPQNKKKD